MLALVCCVTVSGSPVASLSAQQSTTIPAGPDGSAWVESTLESLTLEEAVGQLVMVWMTGGYASRTDRELVRIEGLVEERGIGGVVISIGTPHSYVSRLNRLQSLSELPLLVTADFESGPGFRVGGVYAMPSGMNMGGATKLPPMMAFGATDDEALAYEAGRITAIEARALGVHLTFSPVVDVNNNPENPIINTRSFGEDPQRVAALGAAYIEGARDGGLMTTVKHFPGHGDTATDSHIAVPVIPGDRARLDSLELVPFRRAIEAGVDAVMTAHVAAPGILGPDAPPATLSPYFMTELLREEMGFDGVLFTDALDMGAIVSDYGAGEAAVRALEAGADVLLMPDDPELAIEAIVEAVEDGRISRERIDASVRRLLEMKVRANLHVERLVDAENVTEYVGTAEHLEFADSVARRSLALVRDLEGVFPIDTTRTPSILSITYSRRRDVTAGTTFDDRLSEAANVTSVRVTTRETAESLAGLSESARDADLVVVSTYTTPVASDGETHPLNVLLAGAAEHGAPGILISFGSPYVASTIQDAGTYLVAWGRDETAEKMAADALLGRTRVTGRLPITLPPYDRLGGGLVREGPVAGPDGMYVSALEVDPATVGMDSATLARVDRLITQAIRDSVTPGAALAVGRAGQLARLRGYGRLDWAAGAGQVTDRSLYDLASLTKVIATTTAVMHLVESGSIALGDPVSRYLDEWAVGWKADVTLRHLMLHKGGLEPFRPFWRDLSGRAEYRAAIAELEPDYGVGDRTVYSDIGLITLQFVIETVTGQGLDEYVGTTVFEPLGMDRTLFNPPTALWPEVAPTEIDEAFRGRLVRGEVHDENAFALGGVAGHAGLFSGAADLARFGAWITQAARAGRGLGGENAEGLPSGETVARFVARADAGSSRALGWDTPSGRSSAGRFFSADSFGHTGFTGTSFWVDPARDLFVVLLTNRVNPTRAERGHIPLRRAVHDAVATSIVDQPVEPRERP